MIDDKISKDFRDMNFGDLSVAYLKANRCDNSELPTIREMLIKKDYNNVGLLFAFHGDEDGLKLFYIKAKEMNEI